MSYTRTRSTKTTGTKIECAAGNTENAIKSHERFIQHPNTPNFDTVMESTRVLAEHLQWRADAIRVYIKTANAFGTYPLVVLVCKRRLFVRFQQNTGAQSQQILLEILGVMLPNDRVFKDMDSLAECEVSIQRVVNSHLDKDVLLSASDRSTFRMILWNFVVKILTSSREDHTTQDIRTETM